MVKLNEIDRGKIRDLFLANFEISDSFVINEDGTITITGDCNRISNRYQMNQLPVKFREVIGYNCMFSCSHMGLATLQGVPPHNISRFYCDRNMLESLKGAPNHVSFINAKFNPLTSLDGLPDDVSDRILLTWSPNLPILRLLKYSCKIILVGEDEILKWDIVEILDRYKGIDVTRSNILQCQKELIKAGFESNASW